MVDSLGFSVAAVAGASVGVGGVAWMLSWTLAGRSKRRLGRADQLAVIWLLYNSIIHFTLVRGASVRREPLRHASYSSAGSFFPVLLPPRNRRVFGGHHGRAV